MTFLCVNQGEQTIAKLFTNSSPPSLENLILKLFKNNWTPADGDTEANATEATFTGYSAITLPGYGWSITPGAPTLIQYPEQLFQSTADQTAQPIYGYYLVGASSNKLLFAWRLDDGPYSVASNGDKIYITPKLQIKKVGE
jgi:hypothetical protein